MKVESYLLRGLFMLCMVLCFATLGSMLFPAQRSVMSSAVKARIQAAPAQASVLDATGCTIDAPCKRLD